MDEPVDRCDTSLHLCRRCILGDRMVHAAGKVIRQRQMAAFPVRGIRTVRLYVSYKEKATWKKILGISIGLVGALVCILTQQSDDLASDAFMGNMLCLISSVVYAVYLILSQRILSSIGAMTMLRYTFSGAAVSAIIVTFITGFDAPVFSMPFHWTPFLILMFVLIFPATISYMLLPVGLKYLKTTVVAIYGYLILIVATIASLALGQDRFSWTQTCAIIFICIGVYLVEVAESKDKSPDPLKK